MVAFPAFKLGAILLKQISKPLANAVKTRAKNSPFFRTYICMPPAQFYHWCDVKLKMWSMNLGKPVNVAPLNENMAIELGAELLGEGIIFTIAAAVLTFEYIRQSRKESLKEEDRKEEMARIQTELKELYFARAKQETQMRELLRVLRINIPSLSYADPTSIDTGDIPEHHRNETVVDEGTSIFTKLNNAVWSVVEFVVPPVEDSGKSRDNNTGTGPVVVLKLKVLDDKETQCPEPSSAIPPPSSLANLPPAPAPLPEPQNPPKSGWKLW